MPGIYDLEVLTEAVTASTSWAELLRRMGFRPSGGRRRVVQEHVRSHGIDTSHFKKKSPWRKYSDEAIREAVASSTTLREVAGKLGARPATGTLSHIRRRILVAGFDTSHFPALNYSPLDLPFTREELATAAAASSSIRSTAELLGIADDSRSRSTLRRMLTEHGVDLSHFTHFRKYIAPDDLRSAVAQSSSYAEVMRRLELAVNDANHRHLQRRTVQLGFDRSHFTRTARRRPQPVGAQSVAGEVLRVQPPGSVRTNHTRLRRALEEIGIGYLCTGCGNPGEWQGVSMTLQIDHINGDWRDNRRQNLRYLCPNCHAITDTWCGRGRGGRRRGPSPSRSTEPDTPAHRPAATMVDDERP
ncbi:HNH endonuclease [Streptomyces sp. N2-109]|uniref:HNH endonuclease n=1 Tax=Streptomyces gossypii TaxID=2883101 RepID=A0ABT2JTN0_9ACTN|nr:HNH endonuclease [Streptomyces gossypii]MCT2591232.1 HNH endonuclease [Streptomyces gossypii]